MHIERWWMKGKNRILCSICVGNWRIWEFCLHGLGQIVSLKWRVIVKNKIKKLSKLPWLITFIPLWNIPTLMEVVSSRMTMAPSILQEESPNGLMSINMMWILCNPAECPWEILAWCIRQRCLPPSIKAPNEGMSFMRVILVLPPLDFQELWNQSQTPLKYSGTHHLTHAVYSCFSFNLSSCAGLWTVEASTCEETERPYLTCLSLKPTFLQWGDSTACMFWYFSVLFWFFSYY